MAGAAPIRPEIHHDGLGLARLDYIVLKVCVANCLNVVCHVFPLCAHGNLADLRYFLDVRATFGIRDRLAASYTVTYAAAEAFQEKSLAMPLAITVFHSFGSR